MNSTAFVLTARRLLEEAVEGDKEVAYHKFVEIARLCTTQHHLPSSVHDFAIFAAIFTTMDLNPKRYVDSMKSVFNNLLARESLMFVAHRLYNKPGSEEHLGILCNMPDAAKLVLCNALVH